MSKSVSRRVAVTPGEPAGVGLDICLALADASFDSDVIYIADPDLFRARASHMGLSVPIHTLDSLSAPLQPGINVFPVKAAVPISPAQPDTANARYVIECLEQAVKGCESGELSALVTGPINKAIINEGGIPFSGHTEWLADRTATNRVVMMLATDDLRVALATTHLPLKDVSAAITQPDLIEVLGIIHKDMSTKFGISEPRILVCGLNPHAGEGGHLGREEIDTIIPALEQATQLGIQTIGPVPADTAFTPPSLERADCVLAMYHDQGLPVLKYAGFSTAINITLGLPIIRTSVDHGTAFDLAGTGKADTESLRQAILHAIRMSDARA